MWYLVEFNKHRNKFVKATSTIFGSKFLSQHSTCCDESEIRIKKLTSANDTTILDDEYGLLHLREYPFEALVFDYKEKRFKEQKSKFIYEEAV